MITFKAICLRDHTITDGDKVLELKRGQEYRISEVEKDGNVTVFTSPWWGWAPPDLFAGIVPATK